MRQVLFKQRLLVYYLLCSNQVLTLLQCWSLFQSLHRTKATQKLRKRRSFMPKLNGGPDRQHSYLVCSRQMIFKFTPTPALPRCLSNKVNIFLRSKEKPATQKLTHRFHNCVVCLGKLYYLLWEMPRVYMGELSPVTLKIYFLIL